MTFERKELDVREAQTLAVVGERRRGLAVCERAVALFRNATPGAQVYFVDEQGLSQMVFARAPLHPVGVAELILRLVDDRVRRGRDFGVARVRVCLKKRERAAPVYLVLVARA